ncbi:Thiamine-monophosphate kinase [Marinobacterium sp. xm-a-121]|uniref:thiamine-phosphate kinase n=1 Tax=unclassified Marinobacterium TaxID=2644139 RepID=UPI0015698446|nr:MULTISPECIES: thiamine-phosphate kinase [unclassified Marinobacterium]NRP39499.1 Thiamine-monophosphate kinase [Marinobacterium sp. xm-a-121]NRQ00376.1 Thiamine-monophosphate kinase [Marinobacterium sp. xm-v-233]
MPGEFDLIRRYFDSISGDHPSVQLGIGDDCALLMPSPHTELAISVDTLVEGVHFLPDIDPEDLAWRLVACSVSDLAAMGASPKWLTLACTLNAPSQEWLAAFSKGLAEACHHYSLILIGGDTTSGQQQVFTAQVHGEVPLGMALKRGGAKVGDAIVVSGTLGDSRAGLALLTAECDGESEYLLERYYRPTARLALGEALRGIANAAVDVSDGLLADLGHILTASGVGAEIHTESLPLSADIKDLAPDLAERWALSGGEDFELCFTLPQDRVPELQQISERLALPLTLVGKITQQTGITLLKSGEPLPLPASLGFNHFGNEHE